MNNVLQSSVIFPEYIKLIFGLTTILTVLIYCRASNYSKPTFVILLAWLLLQAFIGLSGFYWIVDSFPPRFALLVFPPLLTIVLLFVTSKGRKYLDGLDLKTLTILHVIRIPVELTLFWLFVNKSIPELMTFEGRNFDILSGITAPLIYYFGFVKKKLSRGVLLTWNFICLGLLINIVAYAILSAPFPFQKFAFDQPNVAIFYFPFNWLPCCVVPLVLLSHLASIRQLMSSRNVI